MVKTLQSVVGTPPEIVSDLWSVNTNASTLVVKDIDAHFDEVGNSLHELGFRFPRELHSNPASGDNLWLDFVGPGVMSFLAVWMVVGTDNINQGIKVVIDGTTVFDRDDIWKAASDVTDGAFIVGFWEWDTIAEAPRDPGGPWLDHIAFETEFKLYLTSDAASLNDYQLTHISRYKSLTVTN